MGKTVHEVKVSVLLDGHRVIRAMRRVKNGQTQMGLLVTATPGVNDAASAEIESFLAPIIGTGMRQVVGEVKG